MKSFVDFTLICEKLNKTHDENSQSKLWNYFIANSDNTKVRDLILSKDFEEAEKEIKKELPLCRWPTSSLTPTYAMVRHCYLKHH